MRNLTLCLYFAAFGAGLQGLDPAALSREGKELMAAGRFSEAAGVYQQLVKALPGNPGIRLNLGMALHMAGEDRRAITELERVLKVQPNLFPAAVMLGSANMRVGRPAAAIAPLQRALRLDPSSVQARGLLAEALFALERYTEAEPQWQRLSELDANNPSVWYHLGRTYEGLAGRAFDSLRKLNPESAYVLAAVAESRTGPSQRRAAFTLYRQALERAPAMRGLNAALAEIYRETGHPDWAKTAEARERGLQPPDCTRDTLECSFAAGRYRQALAAARPLKTAPAYYWTVRACNQLAHQAFARLASLPPSAESYEVVALVHRTQRLYGESAEAWRKALQLQPGDTRLRLELAATLRMNNDLDAAREILQDLVKTEPEVPDINYLLGDVLLAQQQPNEALPFLEKAVKGNPKLLQAHGALGRTYALIARPKEAIDHLRLALPADEDGSLRLALARAYQAAGDAGLARSALQDYEAFRKSSQGAQETLEREIQITPP